MLHRSAKCRSLGIALLCIAAASGGAHQALAQTTPAAPTTTPLPTTVNGATTTTTTTTNPDGSITTTYTTTVTSQPKPASAPVPATESPLKYRWGTSLGSYSASDKAGQTQFGYSSKIDYYVLRSPTIELLLSDNASVTSLNLSRGLSDLMVEFRWRMEDAGRLYTGINVGSGSTSGLGSGASGLATGAVVGYLFPSNTFVEYRFTGISVDHVGVSQVMVGYRY